MKNLNDDRICYVTVITNYGCDRMYPDCDQSRLLVELSGSKKTITPDTLRIAKKLGFRFLPRQQEEL